MNRLSTIQSKLQSTPIDMLVLIPGENYYYATGAPLHPSERLNFLFIPKRGTPVALAPELESPYIRPLGIPVYAWRDEEGPQEALQQLLKELGSDNAVMGLEYGVMRFGEGETLRAFAPGARFQPADGFLSSMRSVKDAAEVAKIRRAIEVTEEGFRLTLPEIRAGRSEREIAGILQVNLLKAGADGIAFGPLVVSGPRTAEPHAGASDRILQPGDAIIIDWGATVDHYHGDITRCLAIEPVPEELFNIHEMCRAANAAGRAAAEPGVSGAVVDAAARTVIDNGGYGQYFVHRTGHGLGLSVHETPYIVANNDQPLAEGNCFTIEPGIYVPGLGGVRVEDNMILTATGAESLTTFPRDLIRIPG
jgi:Xaa-Pro dipeptidase